MYKVTLLLALGFAAASAFQRDLQGQMAVVQNITTTCNRGTTETCTVAGYCCAAVTRNSTAVNTNATLGTCVPAEFHTQTFNLSGTTWTFNCAVPATSTGMTFTSCNSTNPCANTSTQCCAPRSWTVAGVAGSKTTVSACITKTVSGAQYSANWNVTTQGPLIASASVSATCPNEGTTGGDGSFAAAIKVTAVMVLALVAGMFF